MATLTNFNSLFELSAGFNFAYTLSDEFNANLNQKILNSFTDVKNNIKNVKGKIELAKNNLHQVTAVEIPNVIDSTIVIHQAKEELNEIETKCSVFEQKANKEMESSGITKSFTFLCLFNALYSLAILFIAGFFETSDGVHNKMIHESIFVINFFSSLFILYCLFQENLKVKYTIGYLRSLIWFLFIMLLGAVCFCICKYTLNSQCIFEPLSTINVIWSIILPIFHFLFYFYRAVRNSLFISRGLIKEINAIENEFDGMDKQHQSEVVQFHKIFEKYKIGNK